MNNNVLTFNLYGKFAHFKKFYSNKSSLTYKLPPSTVIMGIIASILEEPRDSYYNWLNPKKSRIGVKILSSGYNHFECMNYLSNDEAHTQTRLELLTSRDKIICYKIYFLSDEKEKFYEFKEKLGKKEFGYGLYLGQRQFICNADFEDVYQIINVYYDYVCDLSTLTYKENIVNLSENTDCKINIDMMPISFKNEENGKSRISELKSQVVYEENGKLLNGKFVEVLKLNNDEIISFFTPFDIGKYNEYKFKVTSR